MSDQNCASRAPAVSLTEVADLFRNYRLASLDAERDAPMVIRRVLALGTWEQTVWLFRLYGWDRVRQVFLADLHGLRTLPASARALWETVFGIIPPPAAEGQQWRPTRTVQAPSAEANPP